MKTALRKSLDQLHSLIERLPEVTPYRVEFCEDEKIEIEIVANNPYLYMLLVGLIGVSVEQQIGSITVSLWKGYDE